MAKGVWGNRESETQMKKRCHSSSSSSLSSSSARFENADQPDRDKLPKRRRSLESEKCKVKKANSQSHGRRSSIYRGVTRHRWTGKFEAHLWDKTSWNSIQTKKGRQIYLGAYDSEEAAGRTYDLAALKYWGPDIFLNFPIETYTKEIEEMQKVTKQEYLASLRRQSSGFSRGHSKYRGVARHHNNGKWEARIGKVLGNKYLYLGIYDTQEEAAAAYDMAAIEHKGLKAVTNFDISNYNDKIKKTETETQKQTAPKASSESEKPEIEQKTQSPSPENLQQQQQNPQPQVRYTQVLPNEESPPMATMDSIIEQNLPWGFHDTGFSRFGALDLPLGTAGELKDIYDGTGFEEHLNFLFRPDPDESDFNLNAILNRPSSEDNGQERLLYSASSSSPSSSTTSVSVM